MLCMLLISVAVLSTVTAQKNLTPFGKATQSSEYGGAGPENAINPPISNVFGFEKCTHTSLYQTPAWWMFNISYGTVFITDIKIYYRKDFAKRMNGFQLLISNTSTISPSNSYICYQDPPGEPYPEINQTIPCNHLGQYVIYYDNVSTSYDSGSVIELCYVSINGCQKKFWGSNCSKSCLEKCMDQHCYPGNGSCVWGCNDKNCLSDICDKSNAFCTIGCKKRRTGNHCNKYNIASDASVSQSPSGTQPANQAIDGDKTTCSKTQGPNVMFHVDLEEMRIATDIYLTGKVNTTIQGQKHTIYTSNSSGSPEQGTVLYQVESLTQHISIKAVFRYLTLVPAMNSSFVELDMCEIGLVGCPATQYGRLCNKTCPAKCHGPCDLETGNCEIGCLNGWIGEKCENACDFGFYGSQCQELCSVNCANESCHHTNGECIGGCKSGWNGLHCTKEKSELQGDSNGATIGGSLGAVIAIILIILAILFIYKRNQKSTKHKYLDKTKPSRQITSNSKRETNHGNEYMNAAITSDLGEISLYLKDTEETIHSESDDAVYKNLPTERSVYKIPIRNLKEVITEKLKNDGFKKEYEILPKGLIHAHVEGSKEENKVKNRFLTTWPYDHSRIVLKGNTKTDYINACYIDNYDKEKAYIAAQGPKKNTVRDFWHMLWQENVGKVVMVTQLKEGKRDKCVQYWPDAVNEPMIIDNYRLTMTKEKEHTLFVYRLIMLSNNTNAKQKERTVHQFHFIQWPDHGVPDSIKLVHFYRKVKSQNCDQNGPMVIHCSAGVGRTGTFIAIDALYEHGKKVGYVDIMEYVQMMRKDRMNMIQTHEQYETVFEALLELFTIPDKSIPKNAFCKYIVDQECKTLPKNQKVYKREFQTLENLRPLYDVSNFNAANMKENISKNLVKNILPHDNFRPYLMSYGKTKTDYINAVIIPGYREESKFFVTQCPIKATVVDFWTLIYDHNSRIIVLLDQVNKNANLWLGKSEMLVVDDFGIMQEEENTVDELEIALEYKNQQDKRIINVFKTSDWQGTALPSTKLMVDLLKSVVSCWNSQNCPITVVCRDGCTKSGLFVAIYLIFDKMKIDEEIDIFQVVRNIQTRRPEFLKNCDQYEYIYKCVNELVEDETMYANT